MSRRASLPLALLLTVLLTAVNALLPTMAAAAVSAGVADAPVLRRAVVAMLCLIGGFALCLRGWDSLDRRRRLRGAGLVLTGWLLGIGALSLLRLNEYPQTWDWWL